MKGSSRRTSPPWPEPVYLDASALVKLFVQEAESDSLNDALIGSEQVIVSDLALTEMAAALGRRVRERRLTAQEARRLQREAENVALSRPELTAAVHRRAERLLLASQRIPLRALDALHLALALSADTATIATYDPRLAAAAAGAGLFVAPETA